LDAGCGGGFYTLHLLRGNPKLVVGIDTSPEMIRLAQNSSKHSNSYFLQMDAGRLTFGDEMFDIVIAGFLLDNVLDYRGVLREFRRVLKEGGVLVLSLPHPFDTAEGKSDYFEETEITENWVIEGRPVTMKIYHRPIDSYMEALVETGFSILRIREPRPTKEMELPLEVYSKKRRIPSYLVIKAAKT
jgi:ubiquinone/menaquinone biosynthesis C-methylase UbiE